MAAGDVTAENGIPALKPALADLARFLNGMLHAARATATPDSRTGTAATSSTAWLLPASFTSSAGGSMAAVTAAAAPMEAPAATAAASEAPPRAVPMASHVTLPTDASESGAATCAAAIAAGARRGEAGTGASSASFGFLRAFPLPLEGEGSAPELPVSFLLTRSALSLAACFSSRAAGMPAQRLVEGDPGRMADGCAGAACTGAWVGGAARLSAGGGCGEGTLSDG